MYPIGCTKVTYHIQWAECGSGKNVIKILVWTKSSPSQYFLETTYSKIPTINRIIENKTSTTTKELVPQTRLR